MSSRRARWLSQYVMGGSLNGAGTSTRIACLIIALPPLAIVVWLFFVPFVSSAHFSLLREDQWSLRNYYLVWRLYKFDVLYTLWIAFVSLVAVLAIAVFLCGYLRLHTNKAVEFLFKIPLFIPFVVAGQLMRTFLAKNGMLNHVLIGSGLIEPLSAQSLLDWRGIVVAFVWKQAPFVTLLVAGAMASLETQHVEAARNLGAPRLRVLWDIVLPQVRGTVLVGVVLSFVTMLSVLSVLTVLLVPEAEAVTVVDALSMVLGRTIPRNLVRLRSSTRWSASRKFMRRWNRSAT